MSKRPFHLLMIGLFSCINILSAQSPDIDLKVVEQEVLYQLNQYREENSLAILERSEYLDAVAFDQAEYVAGKGRIVHEQEKENKKTLLDRILYYEALYAEAGENISMIAPGSKAELSKGGERVSLINEQMIVKAALYSWQKEEDSKLNLDDPNYYELGIGINENERKEIVIVAVLALKPYELLPKLKQKFNFRGVSKYSKEKCKDFDEKFGTAPELFSDAFIVEDQKLFFQYHNKKVIEKILENSSDAISAELILKDQFKCGESNRLFPGEITNGYMMPLLKKSSIDNLNLSEKEGAVNMLIGEIPQAFFDLDYEVNGMIIKNDAKCASIPYNRIQVQNLRWLNAELMLAKAASDSNGTWKDTLAFKINTSELSSELKDLMSKLSSLDFEWTDLKVNRSISPIEENLENNSLKSTLSNLLDLDSAAIEQLDLEAKINWERYKKFQENTVYQIETKEMNEESIVNYLKETAQRDPDLKIFLDSLNYLEFEFVGSINLDESSSADHLELFNFALDQRNIPLALILLNKDIKNDQLSLEELQKLRQRIPQLPSHLPLINNLIVAASQKGEIVFDGNPISRAFLEIHLVDPSVPEIRFNYLLSQLNDWAKRSSKVTSPDSWINSYQKLSSKINSAIYSRVILNYYLIIADYSYEKGLSKEREDAFQEIMRWIPKADLSDQEIFEMAQYLTFQNQSYRAVELLLPIVKTEDPPQEHLLYFLQLSIYNTELVSDQLFDQSILKAAQIYPTQFCELFSKKRMGIQLLEDYQLKSLYCEKCAK